MNNKNLQILLSNIESNGTINSLIDSGLGFKEIADLTEEALLSGFIEYSNKEVKLSEIGLNKLNELRSQMKNISKSEWIRKEEKSKISKIGVEYIFLPRQDDILDHNITGVSSRGGESLSCHVNAFSSLSVKVYSAELRKL